MTSMLIMLAAACRSEVAQPEFVVIRSVDRALRGWAAEMDVEYSCIELQHTQSGQHYLLMDALGNRIDYRSGERYCAVQLIGPLEGREPTQCDVLLLQPVFESELGACRR